MIMVCGAGREGGLVGRHVGGREGWLGQIGGV